MTVQRTAGSVACHPRGCCNPPHHAAAIPPIYTYLEPLLAGTEPAHVGDMKLTQPILKSISHQLCHGNPWWALVVLNEYLEPASPLHVALMRLFWRRVDHDSKLAHRLNAGALYRDLSPEERTLIGPRAVTPTMYARAVTNEHATTRNHTDRRPPSRRAMRSRPTIREQRPRNRSLQKRGYLTSTMSPAAPALRVVQGVARRSW